MSQLFNDNPDDLRQDSTDSGDETESSESSNTSDHSASGWSASGRSISDHSTSVRRTPSHEAPDSSNDAAISNALAVTPNKLGTDIEIINLDDYEYTAVTVQPAAQPKIKEESTNNTASPQPVSPGYEHVSPQNEHVPPQNELVTPRPVSHPPDLAQPIKPEYFNLDGPWIDINTRDTPIDLTLNDAEDDVIDNPRTQSTQLRLPASNASNNHDAIDTKIPSRPAGRLLEGTAQAELPASPNFMDLTQSFSHGDNDDLAIPPLDPLSSQVIPTGPGQMFQVKPGTVDDEVSELFYGPKLGSAPHPVLGSAPYPALGSAPLQIPGTTPQIPDSVPPQAFGSVLAAAYVPVPTGVPGVTDGVGGPVPADQQRRKESAIERAKKLQQQMLARKLAGKPKDHNADPIDPTTSAKKTVAVRQTEAEMIISFGDEDHDQYQTTLDRLKRKRKLDISEEIELKRARNAIEQRKKRDAQETIVIDADDPPEGESEDEDFDNWDSSARQAQRLVDKARDLRRGPRAKQERAENLKRVSETLAAHRIRDREIEAAKQAKARKKNNADANGGSKKTKKKGDGKKKARRDRPYKERVNKKENEANEKFLKMIRTGTHANLDDDSDEEQLNHRASNANRNEYLKELIADVPKEEWKLARKTKQDLSKACQAFPKRMVSPDNKKAGWWRVKGLNYSLRHHQLLGAAFMLGRENGTNNPKGGLLCDDMGLGKTIQTIAVFLAARAKQTKPQATLVVAPSSVVDVWLNELLKHVNEDFRSGGVSVYRSGNRLHGLNVEQQLENCFCVITTYGEVMASMKRVNCPNELVTPDQIRAWYNGEGMQLVGPLHRVKWHRIVLDEGHVIKNYRSATSHACMMLEADRRWILTGTPFVDNIGEFYSYMCWLRMPLAGSREQFLSNFNNSHTAMERMQKTLSAIMLRRIYSDRLFGKKIVKLPQHIRGICEIDFTRLERAIYNIFKLRIHEEIRRNMKVGPPTGRYHHVLKMLTHLRQFTAHFLVGAETFKKILTPADRAQIKAVLAEHETGEREYQSLTALRIIFAQTDAQAVGGSAPGDTTDTDGWTTGGLFGAQGPTAKAILRQVDKLNKQQDPTIEICKICGSILEHPVVLTSCGHMFHVDCLEEEADKAALDEHEGRIECPECGVIFDSSELTQPKWKSPNERKKEREKHKENRDWSWIKAGDSLMSSAKLIAVKAQILNWIQDDPAAKIIIYTQWIPITKCLKRICDMEHWASDVYTGQMSIFDREAVINRFTTDPEKQILIASLKAGGVGLNLTAASRIINLDMWYNYSIEAQAYHRIYRLGQEKITFVKRMVVRDTIDETLIRMQERKQKDIDKALGADGTPLRALSLPELLSLFGDVAYDEDGDPFIVPDHDKHARKDLKGPYTGGERGVELAFEPDDAMDL